MLNAHALIMNTVKEEDHRDGLSQPPAAPSLSSNRLGAVRKPDRQKKKNNFPPGLCRSQDCTEVQIWHYSHTACEAVFLVISIQTAEHKMTIYLYPIYKTLDYSKLS